MNNRSLVLGSTEDGYYENVDTQSYYNSGYAEAARSTPDTLLFRYSGSTQGHYGQAYVSTTIPHSIIDSYKYVTVTGGDRGMVQNPDNSGQYLNLALGVKVQLTAYESLITDNGLTFAVSSNTTGLGFTILFSKS